MFRERKSSGVKVGFVGHGQNKFTPETEALAREAIRSRIEKGDIVVSGRSPMGGVDIYAEEIAHELGNETMIFPPKTLVWSTGYKPRNELIAQHSDYLWVIVVAQYPPEYKEMKFDNCYHCHSKKHVKSGGCWTGRLAKELGSIVTWITIRGTDG